MTSDSRCLRSTGHPAPAANTQATCPPAASKSTVWLSNSATGPKSCGSAATYSPVC
ncbi:hypothetical protein [Streptomyces mangrovisoli]|uniref:hypothetical protein n=1 Tax=Streptomyces mangrovisoli TaxID=1428628 RepID=UPI0019D17964|nr:hypothetical protein [Streptomyces mangrovisoli]